MTRESLSHLREWLYSQHTKSAGIKPFLPVEMWEELSQTVSDLEKVWCGQYVWCVPGFPHPTLSVFLLVDAVPSYLLSCP